MSFKLGDFNTSNIPGFSAILQDMPSMPVRVAAETLPAGDGSLYQGARFEALEWTFDLYLRANSVEEVLTQADNITRGVNPRIYGLQDFTPQAMEPWVWQGVVSEAVFWSRDSILWLEGVCQLNGSLTILTPDPFGYASLEPATRAGKGDITLSDMGNSPHHPKVIIRGVSTSEETITLSSGGNVTEIKTSLATDEDMVFDFDSLEFYVASASTGTRLRNVGFAFTTFHRFSFSGPTLLKISGTADINTVTVHVNSRRI